MSEEWLLARLDFAGHDTRGALKALGFKIVDMEERSPLGQYYRVNPPNGWTMSSTSPGRGNLDWVDDESSKMRIQQQRNKSPATLEFFLPKPLTATELLKLIR